MTNAVIVLVIAVFTVILWNPASRFLQGLRAPSALALSPMLICTGVDSNGVPSGVSDSYSQDDIKDTGIMAYITYSGASPKKTTYQIRWTLDGSIISESPVRTFESDADSLRLNLGKDLSPGKHKIEFIVDGKVQRDASMVIEPGAQAGEQIREQAVTHAETQAATQPPRAERPQRAVPRKKPPLTISVVEVKIPPGEYGSPLSPPASDTNPASSPPEKREPRVEPPKQTTASVVSYQVTHRHSIGTCSGVLELKPQSLEFRSNQHVLRYNIKDVRIRGEAIVDPNGKEWHFSCDWTDIAHVLAQWKSGELFPGSARTEEPAVAPAKESAQSGSRSFTAKHKHRLGSCTGELQITPDSIEFSSPQHYVKCARGSTQIDGDGVLDSNGKNWRFEIPGEDVSGLLRLWKDGKLFQNAEQ